MIHSLSSRIADFFVVQNVAKEEEKEEYVYGIELIISGIISVGIVVFIGAVTGSILYALLYNIMMVVIRMYTGGYHADTHIGCNICYSVTFLISLLVLRLLIYYDVCLDSLMMSLVGLVVIVYYAPLENHNKKLCQKQKDTYECISMAMYIIAIFIASVLLIISLFLRSKEVMLLRSTGSYINIMLMLIAVLLLAGRRKEGKYHAEEDT